MPPSTTKFALAAIPYSDAVPNSSPLALTGMDLGTSAALPYPTNPYRFPLTVPIPAFWKPVSKLAINCTENCWANVIDADSSMIMMTSAPTIDCDEQELMVSVCASPSSVKPAPAVQSLIEVRMTGAEGAPTIETLPPMRSLISSGTPVAVKPAFSPSNLTTRLCEFLLSNFTPP